MLADKSRAETACISPKTGTPRHLRWQRQWPSKHPAHAATKPDRGPNAQLRRHATGQCLNTRRMRVDIAYDLAAVVVNTYVTSLQPAFATRHLVCTLEDAKPYSGQTIAPSSLPIRRNTHDY